MVEFIMDFIKLLWIEINSFSNVVCDSPVQFLFILLTSGLLTYVFHEMGHYLWTVIVTKTPASFHFGRPDGQLAFYVSSILPESRFPDVRQNPEKYKIDRKYAKFMGNLQLLPIFIYWIYFPNYSLYYIILTIIFSLYSLYETFWYNYDEDPWIIAA